MLKFAGSYIVSFFLLAVQVAGAQNHQQMPADPNQPFFNQATSQTSLEATLIIPFNPNAAQEPANADAVQLQYEHEVDRHIASDSKPQNQISSAPESTPSGQ